MATPGDEEKGDIQVDTTSEQFDEEEELKFDPERDEWVSVGVREGGWVWEVGRGEPGTVSYSLHLGSRGVD